MWVQVSMNRALRAFLRGETVKVVDFNAETVLSLEEVLQRFSEGVVMYMETEAVENIEFAEAVEEMTEDLAPIAQNFEQAGESAEENISKKHRGMVYIDDTGCIKVDTETYPLNVVGITEPHGSPSATEMVTAPPSISVTAEAPAPKRKHKGRNKTVAEVEEEYARRKITDLGRLRALRDAGWTLAKLADEFSCSTQTVANTLKRLEEQEAEA